HAARLVLTRHALKAEVGGALVGHGGARSESDETHSSRSAASAGAAIAVAFLRRRRAESRPSRGSCARSGPGIKSGPLPLWAPGARSGCALKASAARAPCARGSAPTSPLARGEAQPDIGGNGVGHGI